MSENNTLYLPEELSISNVIEWKETFIDALQNHSVIHIDSEKLCRVDTAAIQLIYTLIQEIKATEKEFKWLNVSSVLSETASQLGMDKELLLT